MMMQWLTLGVMVVLGVGQLVLGRVLKAADTKRDAQTAILNRLEGAVGDHRAVLAEHKTRLDNHDKEFDRWDRRWFTSISSKPPEQ